MLTDTAVAVVRDSMQEPREAWLLAMRRSEHCIPDLPPDVVRGVRLVEDAMDNLHGLLQLHATAAVLA